MYLMFVKIMTGLRREGRRNFGDQRTDVHKGVVHSISRLILGIVDL